MKSLVLRNHNQEANLHLEFMNDARNFICKRRDSNKHRYSLSNPRGLKIERRRHCSSQDYIVEYKVIGKNGKVLRFMFNQFTMEFIGLSKQAREYKTITSLV